MAPTPAVNFSALNAKHYTVAALTATLAVAVLVTIFFVLLSPARINFSVTQAGHRHQTEDGNVVLTLTLAANNPSRRVAVRYDSMFIDVSNNTGPPWVHWIRANVETRLPLRQPRQSVVTVNAAVPLVWNLWTQAFTGNKTSKLTVIVNAVARFKVGIAQTRLYDIKVTCGPLSFFPAADGSHRIGCS